MLRKGLVLVGTLIATLAAGSAQASIVPTGVIDLSGTGIGAMATTLTIQHKGTESGGVAWNGSHDVIIGSDTKTGSAQTRTWLLSDLGITSAGQLAIVFNAHEPGNKPDITLSALTLNLFNNLGSTVFSASLASPLVLDTTRPGIGNAGFRLQLDAISTAALDAIFDGNLRVGLTATATNTAGGPETFFLYQLARVPTQPVPEPASLALLGVGLAGLGLIRRRRR